MSLIFCLGRLRNLDGGKTALRRFCVQEKRLYSIRVHVFDKTYLIHELLVVRPSAGQRAPEKKFDAITNVKWPEIFQCLCQQLKSVKSIFIKKIINRILKLVFTSMSSPKTRGSMLTASKWRSRQSPMQSLPDTLRMEKCQLISDELIGWSYEITRPSVNYAKDWLDHSFLFPGLVWSEKEFCFGYDH